MIPLTDLSRSVFTHDILTALLRRAFTNDTFNRFVTQSKVSFVNVLRDKAVQILCVNALRDKSVKGIICKCSA
jgi:hypothetical protein